MYMSPTNKENGRKMLCITMDGFWLHRESGKSYKSKIGSNAAIGSRKKKFCITSSCHASLLNSVRL